MANPPKQKGTAGETEFVRVLQAHGIKADRVKNGQSYDVFAEGKPGSIQALATRPDRGRWLVSVPADEFCELLRLSGRSSTIEVKRWRKFVHHTIWQGKFGKVRT